MPTPRRIILSLFGINLCIGLAYLIAQAGWIPSDSLTSLFDLDEEGTLCSWYSSTLLSFSAFCWFQRLSRAMPENLAWAAGMMLLLGFFSLDESASLHEAVSKKSQVVLQTPLEATGPLSLVIVPASILVYLLWRRWPAPSPPGVFFLGLGLLMLSASIPELVVNFLTRPSALYTAEVLLEETGEMTGMTAILLGSYDYMMQAKESAP
jgi:hypothetical protein